MQMLHEQGLGAKAIISSYTLTEGRSWALLRQSVVELTATGSAVLHKPGSGSPATASACAVSHCKTIFPLAGRTEL